MPTYRLVVYLDDPLTVFPTCEDAREYLTDILNWHTRPEGQVTARVQWEAVPNGSL